MIYISGIKCLIQLLKKCKEFFILKLLQSKIEHSLPTTVNKFITDSINLTILYYGQPKGTQPHVQSLVLMVTMHNIIQEINEIFAES